MHSFSFIFCTVWLKHLTFRWSLAEKTGSHLPGCNGENSENVIEIDEDRLIKYLDGDIGKKLFKVSKSAVGFLFLELYFR